MSEVLMGFVGGVFVNRANPHEVFDGVRDLLRTHQIMFANLEGVYTDSPRPATHVPSIASAPAHNFAAYAEAGFNVMSLANNHVLDVGYEAMLETRSRLRKRGVGTCGAGDSLEDARRPAIVEAGGVRVAFLACASLFPMGYEARSDRPGLVPMRASNVWREPFSTLHAPGLRPLIETFPDEADLARLTEDIERAREQADLVVASFHWGDHTQPFHLTDHETRTARYCVDHGADMVIGHHHHALRGMEWYKGKPIMYGLGHFVFDFDFGQEELTVLLESGSDIAKYFKQIDFMTHPTRGWPLRAMQHETSMTVVAWATAGHGGVSEIGFLPCKLSVDGVVHPLPIGSPESTEVVAYLEECNRTQGLAELVVSEISLLGGGPRTLRVVSR